MNTIEQGVMDRENEEKNHGDIESKAATLQNDTGLFLTLPANPLRMVPDY